MNIFITVGTTKFQPLIEFLDLYFAHSKDTVVAQISTISYKTKNIKSFKFTNNINQYYEMSDVIICHAGAGTIYHLLERKKKIIVIPNLNRKDKHQLDIVRFLENNNLAFVAYDLEEIPKLLKEVKEHKFACYTNNNNDLIKSISDIILTGTFCTKSSS